MSEEEIINNLKEFLKGPCEICRYCDGAIRNHRKAIQGILDLYKKQQKEIEELNKALMTATLKIEGLKIETVANPNMSEKEMEFGLVIQKAILTGQCDKCKYLIQCENNPNFKFPKDSWCVKNYEGDK